jgi:hypothetical protein
MEGKFGSKTRLSISHAAKTDIFRFIDYKKLGHIFGLPFPGVPYNWQYFDLVYHPFTFLDFQPSYH